MNDSINSISARIISYLVDDQIEIVGDAWGSPDNRAVLLVHGGGQTRHAWGNTALKLAQHGWYSIAIDMRGHGDSGWHPSGDYRLEAFAEDLRIIAETFDEPPVLVGASLGGLSGLAAEGKSESPLFSSIILVDVAHRHENKGAERIISFMKENMEEGFANIEEAREVIAAYLPHREMHADINGLKKNLYIRPDGRYYWHWDPQFLKCANEMRKNENFEYLSSAARSLRIPTLLIRGHMSDVISKNVVKEFLELVPHAKFVDVKGAGHMIAGDLNDIFTDSVINFLNDLK